MNCTNNIPKVFMTIIAECFPPGHILRSTFNANTVKLSYSTMTNMAQVLAKHRKRHYGHVNDMKEENEDETDKKGTTLSRHIHSLRRAARNSP